MHSFLSQLQVPSTTRRPLEDNGTATRLGCAPTRRKTYIFSILCNFLSLWAELVTEPTQP